MTNEDLNTNLVALENMHKLLIEALRHREQAIIRYVAILGPALGGFMWLLHYSGTKKDDLFTVGTIGVLLLLLLGAVYSLALSYNYRYITLLLAKLETVLHIRDAMLVGWPRDPKDFINRYKLNRWGIPCCIPPEIIKVFWLAFLVGILGVMITVYLYKAKVLYPCLLIFTGVLCFLVALLSPIWFGRKLHKICKKEPDTWDNLSVVVAFPSGKPEETEGM